MCCWSAWGPALSRFGDSSLAKVGEEELLEFSMQGLRDVKIWLALMAIAFLLSLPSLCPPLLSPPSFYVESQYLIYFYFFPFIFISWRLITLQYCSGFLIKKFFCLRKFLLNIKLEIYPSFCDSSQWRQQRQIYPLPLKGNWLGIFPLAFLPIGF